MEWTSYAGSFYGTPLGPLQEALGRGKDVVLLLDGRGARTVKRRFRNAKTVFLLPPSLTDLKKRLAKRRTERKGALVRRLRIAEKEVAGAHRYDAVILNDDFDEALGALKRFVAGKTERRHP